jgi:hypothetical protein
MARGTRDKGMEGQGDMEGQGGTRGQVPCPNKLIRHGRGHPRDAFYVII